MSDIYVSSRSQLLSALSSATGGDTITLAKGNYGAVDVSKSYSNYVTIRSEKPLEGAFTSLKVSGSASNVRFDGVHVDNPGNGGNGGWVVHFADGSRNVQFVNSEVNGRVDNVYDGHFGILIRGASNVLLQNNDIHDVRTGIVTFGARDIRVIDNKIDYLFDDAMKFGSVRGGLIEGNVGGGNVRSGGQGHVDFIQFQAASQDVVIRENVFLAKTTAAIQGIFLNNATYSDITIEDNIISTGMLRGVFVSKGNGIVVQNNTILNVPGEIHKTTNIDVPGGSVVRNNITTGHEGKLVGSNLTLQNVNPREPFYVEDYLVNGAKGRGLKINDLKIVAGSLAEQLGAADTLRELLGGGATKRVVDDPAPPPVRTAPEIDPDRDPGFVFNRPGDIEISGRGDVVDVTHSRALAIEEGSIGFTFEADTVAGKQGLITKDANGYSEGGNHFLAWVEDGALKARFQGDRASTTITARGIEADEEHDVVATFGDDEVSLYLDGKLVGTRPLDMDWTKNGQDLQIGALGWKGAVKSPFDGTISDVFVIDAALRPAEADLLV